MHNPVDALEHAIQIAVLAHEGQRDRAGDAYILHPLRVMHKVQKHNDWMMSCAAVLHDVIEDCDPIWTYSIEALMPPRVTQIVRVLTHIKPENHKQLTRAERDENYFEYIKRTAYDVQAKTIKLADLNDNLFHPARRKGWIGHEEGKEKYLKAYFYLTEGHSLEI
jgi:(p)ppGpp synthase/HD superfamily hydrolase